MASVSIPAFHVSDPSKVQGSGEVFIANRVGPGIPGTFIVKLAAQFVPPADPYPTGSITIAVQLNDGAYGTFISTSIELINSYGTINPTIFMTGQCRADANVNAKGFRYWLMIANNKKAADPATSDIVGFAIHDNLGNRIAYGCGPVRSGDFDVAAI